jgi:hypothetical protein
VITLGGRSFGGPYLLPLWSAPQAAAQLSGLYAVLVPGWRLLTFRALHFGETGDFSANPVRSHPRYAEWLAIAGTDWNLYVATHEMSFSTQAQREAAQRALLRDYKPEFREVDGKQIPSLRTLLLAQALRNPQDK